MTTKNAGKTARCEIEAVFAQLVRALESDDLSGLKKLLLPEAKAFFGNIGHFSGIDEIISGLKWKGAKVNIRRFETVNFVVLSEGDRAQQSSCLLGLLAYDDGSQFYPFQFGGRFANSLVRTADGWKFSVLRFDLEWDNGNTAFARHWKLVDYRLAWEPGMQTPEIVSEMDAPWRVIKSPDYLGTDQEQIAYTFYKYAWGPDTTDYELFEETFADDLVLNFPYFGEMNKREMICAVKKFRTAEAKWQHVAKIININVNGDRAQMTMYRIEPHRIAPFVLTRENYKTQIYSARYETGLRKENGSWLFERIDYFPGAFMMKE